MSKFSFIIMILFSGLFINYAELKEIWRFNTEEQTTGGFNIYRDKIYLNAGEYIDSGFPTKILFCIDINSGKQLWKFKTKLYLSHPVFFNDRIIFWDNQYIDKVYCLNKDSGKTIWKFDLKGKYTVESSGIEGFLYLADINQKYYHLDYNTGKLIGAEKIEIPENNYPEETIINYKENKIKIIDRKILCNNNDKIIWEYDSENIIEDSVIYNQNLFFATETERSVHCLDCETGKHLWKHDVERLDNVHEPDMVNFNFKVYNSYLIISTYNGDIYCLQF